MGHNSAGTPPPRRSAGSQHAGQQFGPPPRPSAPRDSPRGSYFAPRERAGGAEPDARGATARRQRPRPPIWAVVAVALVVLLAGGGGVWMAVAASQGETVALPGQSATPAPRPSQSATTGESASPTPATPQAGASEALAMLEALAAVPGRSEFRYERDAFGQRWVDVDRNGCDTRNDVLGRDLLNPVFKVGTGGCKVLAGTLIDPYTGEAIKFVSGQDTSVMVQIDHVVALAWAWHHGADLWSPEQRLQFANDPANLVAAGEASNQEKSAYGPGEWLPAEPELRCAFVTQFVAVLGAYELGIGARDRAAAEAVLSRC